MTPQERRAKYPLPEPTPMTDEELANLRERTANWLTSPTFTDRGLDNRYFVTARLLATLDAALAANQPVAEERT